MDAAVVNDSDFLADLEQVAGPVLAVGR
jgi:hypothetical protein